MQGYDEYDEYVNNADSKYSIRESVITIFQTVSQNLSLRYPKKQIKAIHGHIKSI